MSFPINVEDDGTPRAALDVAGQGVRAFNHRSHPRFDPHQCGWRYPSDAYAALGELTYLIGMLPQVFEHIDESMRGLVDAEHVVMDHGSRFDGDPRAAVNALGDALHVARQAARTLYRAVADAQVAINAAAYCGPDLE